MDQQRPYLRAISAACLIVGADAAHIVAHDPGPLFIVITVHIMLTLTFVIAAFCSKGVLDMLQWHCGLLL